MNEKMLVSVPICDLGSRLDFHCSPRIAVIKLPLEALGDAEEIRQEAFLTITYYESKVKWHYTAGDRLLTGELELSPWEIHRIANLAKRLAEESENSQELSKTR